MIKELPTKESLILLLERLARGALLGVSVSAMQGRSNHLRQIGNFAS